MQNIQHQDDQQNHSSLRSLYRFRKYNPMRRCCSLNKQNNGSRLSLHFPTKERVARWYGSMNYNSDQALLHTFNTTSKEHCNNGVQIHNHFNHILVGITNPTLHVTKRSKTNDTNRDKKIPNNAAATIHSIPKQAMDELMTSYTATKVPSTKTTEKWWPYCPDHLHDWRKLVFRLQVGYGCECYKRCCDAALQWEFQCHRYNCGIVRVNESSTLHHPIRQSHSPQYFQKSHPTTWKYIWKDNTYKKEPDDRIRSRLGHQFITYTSLPSIRNFPCHVYTINPVTVVYDIIHQRAYPGTTYSASAYATQQGHWLCGEERVTVCYRHNDNSVDVEIVSFSRPSPQWMGRLIWPWIGSLQHNFFQQQMNYFQQVATPTTFE